MVNGGDPAKPAAADGGDNGSQGDAVQGPAAKKPRLPADANECRSMSSRRYMDELIVPTLTRAMTACTKQRPVDPLEFIGNFLLNASKNGGDYGDPVAKAEALPTPAVASSSSSSNSSLSASNNEKPTGEASSGTKEPSS